MNIIRRTYALRRSAFLKGLACLAGGSHGSTCIGLVATLLALCAPSYGQQMAFPSGEWQMATPESMLVDSAKLQEAVEFLESRTPAQDAGASKTIIIRNGRMLWQGSQVESKELVYSMTKSFATTVLGLLIDDGVVSLDTLAKDFVPNMAELYPDVTLRHLATHTSGYMARGEAFPLRRESQIHDNSFDLVSPLFEPPGSRFAYSGLSGMDQMMNVLKTASGQDLQDLFQQRVGDEIGIEANAWDWINRTDGADVSVDGGGIGIRISAPDAARLGHLFLNGGTWDGKQLISTQWVEEATQVQVPETIPNHPGGNVFGSGTYGYGWWIRPSGYAAVGAFNNHIQVNPSLDLVVARLGRTPQAPFAEFINRIEQSVITAVWDGEGDGRWDHIDATTGDSRWTTENGIRSKIYPTAAAVIGSNTVHVEREIGMTDLSIDGGRLEVSAAGSFSSTKEIRVHQDGSLQVDGQLLADRLDVAGRAMVGETGVMSADLLTLGGDLTIDGTAHFELATINGGTATLGRSSQANFEQLNHTGGTFIIDGRFNANQFDVADGTVIVHDHESPYDVSGNFSLSHQSELRFVVSDESWGSSIRLGEGVAPIFDGELVVQFSTDSDPRLLEGKTVSLFDWSDDVQVSSEFSQITFPTRFSMDLDGLYSNGDIVVESVRAKPVNAGDFNDDDALGVSDVDELSDRIQSGSNDGYYDLNNDNEVSAGDLHVWVKDLRNTWFGDADLDGEFNSEDLVAIFTSGEYEDDIGDNSGWAEGDWDADGDFTSGDLVVAFQDGGYEVGLRDPLVAVPEPSGILMFSMAASVLSFVTRPRRKGMEHVDSHRRGDMQLARFVL